MSKFFDELTESVQQMNEIMSGEREPSREFHVDALPVKESRDRSDTCMEAINRSSLPPKPDAQ
jgi:hypothetical protein